MLKSMTAYSRSVLVVALGRFVVELQSVNRKFLEVNTFLPKLIVRFDGHIKKWIAENVKRGQVNVRLSVAFNQSTSVQAVPNLPLAAQVKASWDQIAKHLGVESSQFTLDLLAREEGVILYEEELQDEKKIEEALYNVFRDALKQLVKMKELEGSALEADISARLEKIKKLIDSIAKRAPDSVRRYKEKLLRKMQDALTSLSIHDNDERLMKEVCLFADRVDIAEEITRFNSHLIQFNSVLISGEAVGKTLEFLLQELSREINTIGSKAADVEISHFVIEGKAELERIREQIQNVE